MPGVTVIKSLPKFLLISETSLAELTTPSILFCLALEERILTSSEIPIPNPIFLRFFH